MYSTRREVEKIYGRSNVKQWADLENDGDSEVIQERIDYFGEIAEEELNGDLGQCPYSVPFVEPYPKIIIHLCALKQGILLYDGRRVVNDETENQVSAQEKRYRDLVNKINADTFKIKELERLSTKPPKVVPAEEDENGQSDYSAFRTIC